MYVRCLTATAEAITFNTNKSTGSIISLKVALQEIELRLEQMYKAPNSHTEYLCAPASTVRCDRLNGNVPCQLPPMPPLLEGIRTQYAIAGSRPAASFSSA